VPAVPAFAAATAQRRARSGRRIDIRRDAAEWAGGIGAEQCVRIRVVIDGANAPNRPA